MENEVRLTNEQLHATFARSFVALSAAAALMGKMEKAERDGIMAILDAVIDTAAENATQNGMRPIGLALSKALSEFHGLLPR